jgi:hypothetical protein
VKTLEDSLHSVSDSENGESGEERSQFYLVEIKRSARRRSVAAGEHVRQAGRYRRFASKALAREWAREHSAPGEWVWIQDTLSTDRSPADGYLVGGRRSGGARNRSRPGSQASIGTSATEFGAQDRSEANRAETDERSTLRRGVDER